jgi:hypothetical protein
MDRTPDILLSKKIMPKIDKNRLKGNYATHVVASWLSRVCLVRPVAEGTDIGVDLYCESVVSETPYLHFWVQVKAITQKHIIQAEGKETVWFDFETKHLRYWERQPIPVYAFLVLVNKWPPVFPDRLYTIRITEHIIRNSIPTQSKKVRLKTSDWADVKTIDEDLQQFVSTIVPSETAAMLLSRGIVAPIPYTQDTNEQHFVVRYGVPYLPKILENIRDASIIGLHDALTSEANIPENKKIRKRFEAIASLFEDELHDFGLSMLVRAAHTDGEIDKAKNYILRALTRVEADTSLLDVTPNEIRKDKLRRLLKDFE